MLFHGIRFIAFAAALAILVAAYTRGGLLPACGALAVIAGGVLGVRWMRADRARADVLHDPAVSTLVFPPESRFQHAVRPRPVPGAGSGSGSTGGSDPLAGRSS
jgi:hypothetical protein